MVCKIVLLERAINEIEDAYWWFEKQTKGVGDRFLKVLEEYKKSILANPELFKKTYKDFRERGIKNIPFFIDLLY